MLGEWEYNTAATPRSLLTHPAFAAHSPLARSGVVHVDPGSAAVSNKTPSKVYKIRRCLLLSALAPGIEKPGKARTRDTPLDPTVCPKRRRSRLFSMSATP